MHRRVGRRISWFLPILVLAAAGRAGGSEPAATPPTPTSVPAGMEALIRAVALEMIPREYEKKKEWGKTKRIVRGLDASVRGLRIHTHRRRKEVNHGTWKMYRLRLVEPEENLHLQIGNLRYEGGGRIGFDAAVRARLFVQGRVQEWAYGVRLVSISGDAEADVSLKLHCLVGIDVDGESSPPAVTLRPEVTSAELSLDGFRLQRISHAKGKLVAEIGRGLRDVVDEKIAEKQPKLVAKINRQINRRQDK